VTRWECALALRQEPGSARHWVHVLALPTGSWLGGELAWPLATLWAHVWWVHAWAHPSERQLGSWSALPLERPSGLWLGQPLVQPWV
jgi:hypothetical protein